MSSVKRQHWVPQFYLRQFAIPATAGTGAEQVWALSRHKDDPADPRQFTVKDAAVETFLYSPKHPNGSRDFTTENKLAGLESTLAKLWPHLATEELAHPNVRKILALFLATLHLRHPRRRSDQKHLHAQLVRNFEYAFGALGHMPPEIRFICRGHVRTMPTAGFDEWKNATDEDLHHLFVEYLNWEAIDLANILLAKRWWVIDSDAPVFATSDEPLVLESPPERGPHPAGFATPGVTLSFAISPHRLLRLDDKPGEDGVCYSLHDDDNLPFPSCAVFNYSIWVNAHRFMFSHRRSDEVIREIATFVDWARCEQSSPLG